jgi:hypothetical protein
MRGLFTIYGLMIVVLVAALDCAIVSVVLNGLQTDPHPRRSELLIVAVLPFGNVLLFGIRPATPRREGRPERRAFWVGFERCGGLALMAVLFGSVYFTDALHRIPMGLWERYRLFAPGPVLAFAAFLIFFLPQLAIAFLGGALCRRFEVLRRSRGPVPGESPPR